MHLTQKTLSLNLFLLINSPRPPHPSNGNGGGKGRPPGGEEMSEEEKIKERIKENVKEIIERYISIPLRSHDFTDYVEKKLGVRLHEKCKYLLDKYPVFLERVNDVWGGKECVAFYMGKELVNDEIVCEEHKILVNMVRIWAEVLVNTQHVSNGRESYIIPIKVYEIEIKKKEKE